MLSFVSSRKKYSRPAFYTKENNLLAGDKRRAALFILNECDRKRTATKAKGYRFVLRHALDRFSDGYGSNRYSGAGGGNRTDSTATSTNGTSGPLRSKALRNQANLAERHYEQRDSRRHERNGSAEPGGF